jgi:hypothetical protein
MNKIMKFKDCCQQSVFKRLKPNTINLVTIYPVDPVNPVKKGFNNLLTAWCGLTSDTFNP